MKLILLIAFLILTLMPGCHCSKDGGRVVQTPKADTVRLWNSTTSLPNDFHSPGYEIVIIDGCEYIYMWFGTTSGGGSLTHKGDCHNPIHKQIYHEIDTIYNDDMDTSFLHEGGDCK